MKKFLLIAALTIWLNDGTKEVYQNASVTDSPTISESEYTYSPNLYNGYKGYMGNVAQLQDTLIMEYHQIDQYSIIYDKSTNEALAIYPAGSIVSTIDG